MADVIKTEGTDNVLDWPLPGQFTLLIKPREPLTRERLLRVLERIKDEAVAIFDKAGGWPQELDGTCMPLGLKRWIKEKML